MDNLGLNNLGDNGKTAADRLRAKRLRLLKEKELAFEAEQKPTRRDYAAEKVAIQERLALKKQFAEEQAALERDIAQNQAAVAAADKEELIQAAGQAVNAVGFGLLAVAGAMAKGALAVMDAAIKDDNRRYNAPRRRAELAQKAAYRRYRDLKW